MRIFIFVCLCLHSLPAFAFAPDDSELTELLHENYGALSSWEAEMTFPEFPDVSAHLWYARGKWRQEWNSGAQAVGINGHGLSKCTAEEFAVSPLFVWMVPNPVETWKAWGVDNATRSLGFCDDLPCYMYGADEDDKTSPAVYLNNEDFSPIMIRFLSEGTLFSVNYGEYTTFKGFRLPEMVRVTMGGDRVLMVKVKWIEVNRANGEDLYSGNSLSVKQCLSPPSPFDILGEFFHYPAGP